MRVALVVLAVLALSHSAGPALAQRVTFERELPVDAGATLDVTTANGAVSVARGPEGIVRVVGTVTVRIGFSVPADAVAIARGVADRPPIEATPGRVALMRPASREAQAAVTVSYRVWVPPTMPVTIRTTSGEVAVSGTGARLSVSTQSGAVSITDAGARVEVESGSGSVELSLERPAETRVRTRSSAIAVRGATGPVDIETQSGQVDLAGRPSADWRVVTGSGAIEVRLDAGSSCRVDARSRSGDVHPGPVSGGEARKGLVTGVVGGGGPLVQLSSRSAAVRLTGGGADPRRRP